MSPVFLHIRVGTENSYVSLTGLWKRKRGGKGERWADSLSCEQWENSVSVICKKR